MRLYFAKQGGLQTSPVLSSCPLVFIYVIMCRPCCAHIDERCQIASPGDQNILKNTSAGNFLAHPGQLATHALSSLKILIPSCFLFRDHWRKCFSAPLLWQCSKLHIKLPRSSSDVAHVSCRDPLLSPILSAPLDTSSGPMQNAYLPLPASSCASCT